MLFIIVPRRESSLYDYLTARFAGVRGVQIIRDRRRDERRRGRLHVRIERRRGDRRQQRREADVFGVTVVRVGSDAAR